MNTSTRIYIANLGKYNEGELVGGWLDLPTTEEELQEFLEETVGINEEYEEIAIHDYESDLPIHIVEYANIMDLSEQIEELERNYYEENKVLAIMEFGNNDMQEVIDYYDSYKFYSHIKDDEDLGRMLLEDVDIPEILENYIDYEKYGEDYREEEGGAFTDHGYIAWW